MGQKKIAIVGTVGVPGNYGGLETLAENLVRYHQATANQNSLTVYCSARAYPNRPKHFLSARLHYVPFSANGPQSVLYDIWSLVSAAVRGSDRILLLGVSGALAIPLIRLSSRVRIITNVDGIEWRREKWGRFARWFLHLSERMAVRHSDAIIADNEGIADHLYEKYGIRSYVIAYGGDHAVNVAPIALEDIEIPAHYALSICRIEPENNVQVVLEAFEHQSDLPLVFVGNWNASKYGRELRARYESHCMLYLLDPVYDLSKLAALRQGARVYVHGHSAGGTNPSLVEIMHFGLPVIAYDCIFNRYTTSNEALFFQNACELRNRVLSLTSREGAAIGTAMKRLAMDRYTWSAIGRAYFQLLDS